MYVYDALISRRADKEPMSHEKAMEIITAGKGKHFDPDMMDALVELQTDFILIANTYQDSDDDMNKKVEYLEKALLEKC